MGGVLLSVGTRSFMALAALATLLVIAPAAYAFDPATEAQNYGKGNERQAIYDTPEYQALLAQVSVQNRAAAMTMQAADPERDMLTHLCSTGENGCAGDVRLYDWQPKGYGILKTVLWTARNGATISGHVWATKAGPAKRPGIVITNGSVQAPEQLYWFVAQTLAKNGYVVLTWDPQGQGQSDTGGESPDQQEGVPAQSDGRPFFDGTEDALNFFFSTPSKPYEPIKSCESGTSHAPKQDRRVKAGLNDGFNPYWQMLDTSRVGIAGHSYGAEGVSYIGQFDPRVKAIVAWDNLGSTDPNESFIGSNPSEQPCPADPSQRRAVPITKPALGMSADYFIPPEPNTSDPDPLAKSQESFKYSKAGVDTGEIIIRGGTHYDFDWIPNQAFPATLRGADEIAWYTNAWFDKYVRGDPTADARLTTGGWRNDAAEKAVDPNGDGNMFSFYYRSRLDIGLSGGGRFVCEDMRKGCPGMGSDTSATKAYDFLKIDTTPDGKATPGVPVPGGTDTRGCPKKANRIVKLHMRQRIVKATVYINGKRVKVTRGHRLRRVVIPLAGRGKQRVKIVLVSARGKRYTSLRTYKGCKKTKPHRVKQHRRHRH
jgi:pimeloyl-ACP methyl ester carboxylesterase